MRARYVIMLVLGLCISKVYAVKVTEITDKEVAGKQCGKVIRRYCIPCCAATIQLLQVLSTRAFDACLRCCKNEKQKAV